MSVPSSKNAAAKQEKKGRMAKTGDDVERIMLALLAIVLLAISLAYAGYRYFQFQIKDKTTDDKKADSVVKKNRE